MEIDETYYIMWKRGLPIGEAEKFEWEISCDLPGMESLILYRCEGSIKFCGFHKSSGEFAVQAVQDEDQLFEQLMGQDTNFVENQQAANLIMMLGWEGSDDEIELTDGYGLVEGLGWDALGVLNLSSMKKKLSKFPEDTTIVIRAQLYGSVDVSLDDILASKGSIFDDFIYDEPSSAVRVWYRKK
jgi:hypothetical protein